jgi:hypothetical protein
VKTVGHSISVATLFALLCLGVGPGLSHAQSSTADPAMAALANEIRQLRVSMEAATRQQAETQALSVYLSSQQSRMVQIAARLDSIRSQLGAAVEQSRHAAQLIATAESDLLRMTVSKERDEAAGMVQFLKGQAAAASQREQQLRLWESELVQNLQVEEQRWNDLIRRLEATISRN